MFYYLNLIKFLLKRISSMKLEGNLNILYLLIISKVHIKQSVIVVIFIAIKQLPRTDFLIEKCTKLYLCLSIFSISPFLFLRISLIWTKVESCSISHQNIIQLYELLFLNSFYPFYMLYLMVVIESTILSLIFY